MPCCCYGCNNKGREIIMDRTKLSEALREYRKKHSLTHYDMTKLLGCHVNTYRLWEMGVSTPGEDYKPKIDKLLKRGS